MSANTSKQEKNLEWEEKENEKEEGRQ